MGYWVIVITILAKHDFLNWEIFSVTRVEAKSEKFDMYMHLDVNTDAYPLREGEKFSMALSSTLNEDGTPDTGYYTQVYMFLPFVHFCALGMMFNCINNSLNYPSRSFLLYFPFDFLFFGFSLFPLEMSLT